LFLLSGLAFSSSLPDTGQTKCYNNTAEVTCPNPGEDFYGQDAQYGPNVQSFTKLDASGNDLPDDAPWPWAMVRDNVTGLIWEVKTIDGSIHDKYNIYDFWDLHYDFVSAINDENFGGYSDWRLPLLKEFSTIVNRDAYDPSINTLYFPNTRSGEYWSGNGYPHPPIPDYPMFFSIDFYGGSTDILGVPKMGEVGYAMTVHGQEISNHFIDNGDGTVTDTDTALMWQQDTAPDVYTWQQALAYCENRAMAGYQDWRLPNVNELQSIVHYEYEVYDPAIDTTYFPDTVSECYWSSTTYADDHSYAWPVCFYAGGVGARGQYFNIRKSDTLYVRAVRDYLDSDRDGIVDDGDRSGIIGDNPCTAGQTADCDDNCPYIANSNQEDTLPPQGNGIGDACECEGDFACDGDVDGSDASTFKTNFGRSTVLDPCVNESPCNGDFSCDGDVDGTDASLFKSDFGRSTIQNPCPACEQGEWCGY
jgi:hypothetical protein